MKKVYSYDRIGKEVKIVEFKDLELTSTLSKQYRTNIVERYYKIFDNAKYRDKIAFDFNEKIYDFLEQHGAKQSLIKKLKKDYISDALIDEVKLYNDYINAFLLSTQLDECEICFGKMRLVGKDEIPYISCWIERRNFVFDMSVGAFYNNDESKNYFYKSYGISPSDVVKISNRKIMNNEVVAQKVVDKLCKADEKNKKEYQKNLKVLKIKINGEGK